MNVSLAIAYVGGLLTLFAPCAALMLPGFFAYAFSSRRALLSMTGIFLLGLEVVLVPLGFAAGTVGAFFTAHRESLTTGAAIVIIVLGAWQALGAPGATWVADRVRARKAAGEVGASASAVSGASAASHARRKETSPLAIFLVGASYGLAGIGCSGPILGAVLTLSGLGGTSLEGALSMAAYGLGVFTPVLVLSLAWDALGARRSFFRPRPIEIGPIHTTLGSIFSGLVFILIGIFLIVSGAVNLGLWDSNTQADAEFSAMSSLSWLSNWMFLAIVAVVVLLIVAYVLARRARLANENVDGEANAPTPTQKG